MIECGADGCNEPATRQQYAETSPEAFAAAPWSAEQYEPRCRAHAGPSSWPLVVS